MARFAFGAVAALLLAAVLPAAAATEQQGAFAMVGGTPRVESNIALVPRDGAANVLDVVQYEENSGLPITQYIRTEHNAIHTILIRDDFRTFVHAHPIAAGNGHFRIPVALDADHRYYAYVASHPAGLPLQVFRFVLKAGAPPHQVATTIAAPSPDAVAGSYEVRLNTDTLHSRSGTTLVPAITAGGRAAVPTPHDGAQIQAVLVNTQTLQYLHIDGSPDLRLPPLPPGLYRAWLQFRIANAPVTVPFTLAAR
jgi:hypothetical protein